MKRRGFVAAFWLIDRYPSRGYFLGIVVTKQMAVRAPEKTHFVGQIVFVFGNGGRSQ